MRVLNCRLLLFAVLAIAFNSLSFADEPATLVGEWKVTSVIGDGKPRDAMNFDGMRWVIGRESLEITPGRFTPAGLAGKPTLKCTYGVDETQSPAHFNWTIGEGDRKFTINAIYELKGDVLRICFGRRGQPRPDGFETTGKESVVYEFQRKAKVSAGE